jgi:hypothetical protein
MCTKRQSGMWKRHYAEVESAVPSEMYLGAPSNRTCRTPASGSHFFLHLAKWDVAFLSEVIIIRSILGLIMWNEFRLLRVLDGGMKKRSRKSSQFPSYRSPDLLGSAGSSEKDLLSSRAPELNTLPAPSTEPVYIFTYLSHLMNAPYILGLPPSEDRFVISTLSTWKTTLNHTFLMTPPHTYILSYAPKTSRPFYFRQL